MLNAFVALALSLHLAAAGEATLSQDSVDAAGDQSVVLKVGRSGMVRLTVDSPTGTACTLVDHLRGPFLQAGAVGRDSCAVDALLDAGLYKVRLSSPPAPTTTNKKTKKKPPQPRARLQVAAFSDLDAPTELSSGRGSVATLPSGRQLTRWLRVAERREVTIDVAGRTAGRMALWRDGQWLVDEKPRTTVERPLDGRSVWRHALTTTLDPGDYAIVVYGTAPQRFSTGTDDDTVFVGVDAPAASPSRHDLVVVPLWGFASVTVPRGDVGVFASVDGARPGPVTVTATRTELVDGLLKRSDNASCSIEPAALQPSCSLSAGGEAERPAVVTVRGAPGTLVRLTWAPIGRAPGSFSTSLNDVYFDLKTPAERVALASLPAGIDAAPLGCALERLSDNGDVVALVARDLPAVGWTQAWKRSFNTDATSTAVWLQIEKPGLYTITGDDARGASCEVYSLGDDGNRERIGEGEDGRCKQRLALPAGPIEVRFYGGRPGIQTLRVGSSGLSALVGNDADAPPRAGCFFTPASALPSGSYRVRTSGPSTAALRAIAALSGGLGATDALALPVDPGRPVTLSLAAGADVVARASGAAGITCTLDGRALPTCMTGPLATAATLAIAAADPTRPTLALVTRVSPASAPPPLPVWTNAPPRLPVVQAGRTAWFDLADDSARLFVVDVATPGLYDLQTEGLLNTRCAVRTATSTDLFSGDGNGRGRNCLVQSYLKPGSYLVSVTRNGRSRGRAGLTLTPRPAWDGGAIAVGDERYVKVEPATLSRHTFTLKKDTTVRGGIAAQGANLSCRLDDDDGWPVKKVPHACSLDDEQLPAGRYTLNVLPLTVESRRSLRLGERATQPTLTGETVHAIALNTPYRAQLSPDGKDQFRFTLAGEVDVGVVLGNGIQGRLYPLSGDKDQTRGDVFATIAPRGGSSFALSSSSVDAAGGDDGGDSGDSGDGEGDGEGYGSDEGSGDGSGDSYGEGSETGEGYDSGSDSDSGDGGYGSYAVQQAARRAEEARASLLRATVHQRLSSPSGEVVRVPAGTWLLETESQSGDVATGYDVRLDVRELLPGVTIAAQAPVVVDVIAPARAAAGLVRLRTRGTTDVACRLVDDKGVLVGESRGSGADWNCALAVPLQADTAYELYVDAEVLEPGPTTLSAEFLEAKDTGVLKDGDTFRVIGKVAQATVQPTRGKVTDVTLTSADEFSCAAFDDDGAVLDRQVAVKTCSLQLWPGESDKPFVVLAWTEDRPASLKAQLSERAVVDGAGVLGLGATADDERVVEVRVPVRGRYATAPDARCLPKNTRGALLPCAGSASFDPTTDGERILVGTARGATTRVDVKELVVDVADAESAPVERTLVPRVAVERARAARPALHLADVRALPGSGASPACALEGGVRVLDASRCVAAAGIAADSLLSLWTRPAGRVPVRIVRRAVGLPSASPLAAGTTALAGVARFALPAEPFRLDVAAPRSAWVVLLDDAERAVDVCAPAVGGQGRATGALARCVVRGRGGSVVVVPSAASAADGARSNEAVRFDLLRFAAVDEPPRALVGVREVRPRAPGRERLQWSSATSARLLRVEGHGVRGCAVQLQDGRQIPACAATLPAGQGGTIVVEHDERPWRAALGAEGDVYGARFGALPARASSSPAVLVPGRVEALGGAWFERTATTKGPGVLRLRATGGVCGVLQGDVVVGSEGLGGGCDLHVVAEADATWRLAVRAFGGAPLSGSVAWTFSPAATLSEGVGDETLVQPGEARVFRVDLAADGELGIGLQSAAEVLDCALLNARHELVAEGCQQFGRYGKGTYWLRVEAPADVAPMRFRPVVFGLKGADIDVPDEWLRDFFRRVPPPATSSSEVSR